jgi:hypothetical protein
MVQVGDQVRNQVQAQVQAQVQDQVQAQVQDQVRDQVQVQVQVQVQDQVQAGTKCGTKCGREQGSTSWNTELVKCCVCHKPYPGKDLPGLICGKCASMDIVSHSRRFTMTKPPKFNREQRIQMEAIDRRIIDIRRIKDKEIEKISNEIEVDQAKECKGILSQAIPEKEAFSKVKKELDRWKLERQEELDKEYQQKLGQLHQVKEDNMNRIEGEYNAVKMRYANQKISRVHDVEARFEEDVKKLEEEKVTVIKGKVEL